MGNQASHDFTTIASLVYNTELNGKLTVNKRTTKEN